VQSAIVFRIDEQRGLAPELPKRRDVGKDQGTAGRSGFENGEAKRLIQSWADEDGGVLHAVEQDVVREIAYQSEFAEILCR